jgi:hypothetical protein
MNKINNILLKSDIDYGTFQENNILPLLKEKFNKSFIKNDWFNLFDFRSQDNLYLIELKSRRIYVNSYSDTMIGLNKIQYAKKVYPSVQCYFIFHFIDGLFLYKFNPYDELIYRSGGRNDRGLYELLPY